MKLSLVIEGFRTDLLAVGELGDEAVALAAERIAGVIGRSATARIMDLLGEAADDVSAVLPEGRVELRLAGDEVAFAYVSEPPPPPEVDAELSARITLRLPESLKHKVDEAAALAGVSVNGWILRLLERGTPVDVRPGRGRTRLHGYGTT
jgi:HicB-like protein involved in pilus formation